MRGDCMTTEGAKGVGRRFRRRIPFGVVLSGCCCLLLSALTVRGADSGLLEVGKASIKPDVAAATHVPSEIKVVSYNMRWRGGDDLRKLVGLLRDDPDIGGAHVIGLQEVDRAKKRTKNVNTARVLAEALGMHYAWAAPPTVKAGKEEETGVAILSVYPLADVTRHVLPHEGPGKRRRAAICATVRAANNVRVCSVHAETRLAVSKKMEQLRATIDDLAQHPKIRHAIVLGDFNTIKGKDVDGAHRLFTGAGFTTPIPNDRSTWKTFIIELKLDWIWLRGLDAKDGGIVRRIGLSDHWPLWVKIKTPVPQTSHPAG